ncbi:hypothetical protein [Streptomyces sp. NBC_00872]|uniref:hypothetical protein n=1 Tax=Streptomyces sp. NBC_00872 TaxID=2903686 RepID=UPI00386535B9|nr:hypothetical protein OG214_36200 [Streptomyces sp. NBC_00872]
MKERATSSAKGFAPPGRANGPALAQSQRRAGDAVTVVALQLQRDLVLEAAGGQTHGAAGAVVILVVRTSDFMDAEEGPELGFPQLAVAQRARLSARLGPETRPDVDADQHQCEFVLGDGPAVLAVLLGVDARRVLVPAQQRVARPRVVVDEPVALVAGECDDVTGASVVHERDDAAAADLEEAAEPVQQPRPGKRDDGGNGFRSLTRASFDEYAHHRDAEHRVRQMPALADRTAPVTRAVQRRVFPAQLIRGLFQRTYPADPVIMTLRIQPDGYGPLGRDRRPGLVVEQVRYTGTGVPVDLRCIGVPVAPGSTHAIAPSPPRSHGEERTGVASVPPWPIRDRGSSLTKCPGVHTARAATATPCS